MRKGMKRVTIEILKIHLPSIIGETSRVMKDMNFIEYTMRLVITSLRTHLDNKLSKT